MSEHLSARHDAGHDGAGARDHGMHRTIAGSGPVHPEEGSALELLLRRQSRLTTAGRLLGFVPAQVR